MDISPLLQVRKSNSKEINKLTYLVSDRTRTLIQFVTIPSLEFIPLREIYSCRE